MTATDARREGLWIIGRRIERPETILLSLVMAGLVTYGWFASSFWLAVAIAAQQRAAALSDSLKCSLHPGTNTWPRKRSDRFGGSLK